MPLSTTSLEFSLCPSTYLLFKSKVTISVRDHRVGGLLANGSIGNQGGGDAILGYQKRKNRLKTQCSY